MAADVSEAAAAPPSPGVPPEAPRRRRPYRLRFGLIYAALVCVLGAAVTGIALLARTGGGSSHAAWSSWKPEAGRIEAKANEIAEHVGRTYRLPNGDQLLDVLANRPSFSDATHTLPVRFVAIHGLNSEGDHVTPLDSDEGQMFSLCGLGESCSIATGNPTIQRGRLVRREALELTLYTFKYVPGVDRVITLFPPRKGEQARLAVYFTKQDLSRELSQPLRMTLEGTTPQQETITAREAAMIDRLTNPHTFKFTVQVSPQGLVLVLAPPS